MRVNPATTTKAEEFAKRQMPTGAERTAPKLAKKRADAEQEEKCFMEAWAEQADLDEIKKNHRRFRRLRRKLARDHLSEKHDEKLAIMHKQQVVKICVYEREAEAYIEKHLAGETYSIEDITASRFDVGSFCLLHGMFVDVEHWMRGILKVRGRNGKKEFYVDNTIGKKIPCAFNEDLLPKAESLVGKFVYVWGYYFSPWKRRTRCRKIVATKLTRHINRYPDLKLSDIYGCNKGPRPDKSAVEIVREYRDNNL